MKDIKTEFTSKIKILIEKTENDDKLIQMLKQEIKRLEGVKGTKSQLSSSAVITKQGAADVTPELNKLKSENSRLKN